MRVVIDIESNSVEVLKASEIWVIVCKDIDTGKNYIFRKVTQDAHELKRFYEFAKGIKLWIGHNIIAYDYPVLRSLCSDFNVDISGCVFDTYIVSKLLDYARPQGHSLEAWGEVLGSKKIKFTDFTQYSQEMEDYCAQDVDVSHRLYDFLLTRISDSGGTTWTDSLELEHLFQFFCNGLHHAGFAFNRTAAERLHKKIVKELERLDVDIQSAFPPRQVLVREFTPRATKFGTISKTSVPRQYWGSIHNYIVGETYPLYRTEQFNASSHKQLIDVLIEAGWKPTKKTKTHIDSLRALKHDKTVDLQDKLKVLSKYGFKIDEENLNTLPLSAPAPARSLARRILYESRRRTLTEWLALCSDDGRIHGKFFGIGAWTHRMAHQLPNTANIPRELKEDGSIKLLGKELRELWIAPRNKLLVGVDAEGIQLRIFAHYINDPEFTDALVRGKKADKSDPHSLNQRILGSICKSRQAAKRFIYALLLGGGIGKLSEIMGASKQETEEALNRLLRRYTGWATLRKEVFPKDAKRGFFIGLDGRKIRLPGETNRDREHLAMSGYLQNGEALCIKRAALIATQRLRAAAVPFQFINVVHDELQGETKNDLRIAKKAGEIISNSIVEAGEYYHLRCPLAGSYFNEDNKDYTIGTNWYQTH